jgi:glycosyltransferase involved in cell wall biosynthesis
VLLGKRIAVVLPAYRAEQTLERTYRMIPHEIVDHVLLVDDASNDRTVPVAVALGINTFVHVRNLGYGANQKTCYREALKSGADVIIMVHPDYQYDPRLIGAMAAMVAGGVYDIVLGSRIIGSGGPLRGGMPLYKYVANRLLTLVQNVTMGTKLSEFHTGFRAFSRRVLCELPLAANSDDFVFDNQMLVQAMAAGFAIGEISCPTRYSADVSSIGFRRSVVYGLGVLRTSLAYRLWRWGLSRGRLFDPDRTLDHDDSYYQQVAPDCKTSRKSDPS